MPPIRSTFGSIRCVVFACVPFMRLPCVISRQASCVFDTAPVAYASAAAAANRDFAAALRATPNLVCSADGQTPLPLSE